MLRMCGPIKVVLLNFFVFCQFAARSLNAAHVSATFNEDVFFISGVLSILHVFA